MISLRRSSHLALVFASFTLAISGFAACATSAEKKDFGEDFSDSGTDAKSPVGDSSTPSQDGSVSPTDGSVEPPRDGSVTPDSSTPDASTCASQIAVLAGSETALSGALRTASGWSTQALTGESATSGPAVVATASGFAAVFRASGDALKATQVTGTTWSAPARIATASTRSTPALALIGTTLHVAYQDTSFQFVHSANSGAAWAAPDAVGAPQSFGPEAPSAAAVGSSLLLAFGGSAEGPLYTQVLTGTTWEAAGQVTGTSVCATSGGGSVTRCGGSPGLLATGGATTDVLAIHIDKATRQLTASTRNATTKTFTSHGAIGAGVTSDVPRQSRRDPRGAGVPWTRRQGLRRDRRSLREPAHLVDAGGPVVFGHPRGPSGGFGSLRERRRSGLRDDRRRGSPRAPEGHDLGQRRGGGHGLRSQGRRRRHASLSPKVRGPAVLLLLARRSTLRARLGP